VGGLPISSYAEREVTRIPGGTQVVGVSSRSRRITAVRVRRGDLVSVRGRWLEVKAARLERYATGGPAVVLLFQAFPALRVRAGERVPVHRRGCR
jgi:hypothetical protein